MIRFACKGCGEDVQVTNDLAGQVIACGACGKQGRAPLVSSPSVVKPPPIIGRGREREEEGRPRGSRLAPGPTLIQGCRVAMWAMCAIWVALQLVLFWLQVSLPDTEATRATAHASIRGVNILGAYVGCRCAAFLTRCDED